MSNNTQSTQNLVEQKLLDELEFLRKENNSLRTRIDHLGKLSIINKVLTKIQTFEELKRTLCRQIYHLTTADEVWLLSPEKNLKLYYGYAEDSKENFKIKESVYSQSDSIFDSLERLFLNESSVTLDNEQIINYPIFKNKDKVFLQHISAIDFRDNMQNIIGLNYFSNDVNIRPDADFLKSLNLHLRFKLQSLLLNEQLVLNEAKFRALTEKLDDVIVVRNLEGVYTYASPSVIAYGYTPDDVLGKTMDDFIYPDDYDLVSSAVYSVLRSHKNSIVIPEVRIRLKNNKVAYTYLTITNLINQKGINGLVINLKDISDTVKANKKLRESELKYRLLFENANDGIFLVKDGVIVSANSKVFEIFNDKNKDIIGKSPFDLSPKFQPDGKESKSEVLKTIQHVLKGNNITFEWVHLTMDNKTFNAQISLSLVNLDDGKYIMSIIRDITETKEILQRIQDSEARLSAIFKSMSDGVFLTSKSCKIEYLNDSMKRQLGDKLDGQICFNTIFGFQERCNWCNMSQLEKGKPQTSEIYNPKTLRYYHLSRTLIVNADGNESYLHISRDITEAKMAETLIKQSEEKFRDIFNNSSDAIFITDLEGNYLEVNSKTLQRSGFSRDEYLRRNMLQLEKQHVKNEIAKYLGEVIQKGQATTETQFFNKDCKIIFTEKSGTVIDYLGKKAILHISRDITERKEIERQILETIIKTEDKERSRFAQDLHDGIGPYLSATKMFLQTLTKEDDAEERLRIVSKAKESIDEIIGNIKEISNNISPHVLKNFGIISAINSFRKKSANLNVNISLNTNIEGERFGENLEISIFRIIIELINNTIKYAKANSIVININKHNKHLYVEYNDDGVGFDVQNTINERKGSGLFNIINRVKTLRGVYEYNSEINKGFSFKAEFELNP